MIPSGPIHAGQRICNRLTGETMTFRRTRAEGDELALDLQLRPLGAPGGAPHRHLVAERFELTQGTVWVFVAGQGVRLARAGDAIIVPSRRWHFVLAVRRTRAQVLVQPAMRFDELLAVWAAIGSGDLRPATLRRLLPLLREHRCP